MENLEDKKQQVKYLSLKKKKGKPDNCRPIGLSSFHGKILKQIAKLFVSG